MAKMLMKGNEAVAEAAIQAGCRFFFGYPITPQNEIPEYMAARLPKVGGTFLQAESEVAAINMVYGAAGAGARVMTSSSSPGTPVISRIRLRSLSVGEATSRSACSRARIGWTPTVGAHIPAPPSVTTTPSSRPP